MFIICLILIFFHIFAFLSPFLGFSREITEHLLRVTSAISGVTSSVVIILLIVLGYKNLYDYNKRIREELFAGIEKQIREWLKETGFDTSSVCVISNEKLRHLQAKAFSCEMKEICEKVHYELTLYPVKLIYGIHFEFDDITLNSILYKKFIDTIDIQKICSDFIVDKEIPKQAGWIFLIRKVELSGDLDKDIPIIATHARHFVELVCHTLKILYGPNIVDTYKDYTKRL